MFLEIFLCFENDFIKMMHSIYFAGYLYPYNPRQSMCLCNTTLDTGYALL